MRYQINKKKKLPIPVFNSVLWPGVMNAIWLLLVTYFFIKKINSRLLIEKTFAKEEKKTIS